MACRTWLLSSALGSIIGVSALPAQAQSPETGPQSVAVVEEVIVTGQRFGSGLSRATFSLGREDIADRPAGAEITQSLTPGQAFLRLVQQTLTDTLGGEAVPLNLRALKAAAEKLPLRPIDELIRIEKEAYAARAF
jgi:hypothetical protein